MKKVYLVDCNSEQATSLDHTINMCVLKWFEDYEEAKQYLVEKAVEVRENFAEKLKQEDEQGNTMSLDLTEFEIDDDLDYENCDSMWGSQEHNLCRYEMLCGRY